MDDVLLFTHGLMKLALVLSVMVLVATAPSQASTRGHALQTSLVLVAACDDDDDDKPSWSRRMRHEDDDRWLDFDDAPSINLDGTPMVGDLDLNGHAYGDSGSAFDSWDGGACGMWD